MIDSGESDERTRPQSHTYYYKNRILIPDQVFCKAEFHNTRFADSKFSELKFKVKLINRSFYQWQLKLEQLIYHLIINHFTNAKLSGAENWNFLVQRIEKILETSRVNEFDSFESNEKKLFST